MRYAAVLILGVAAGVVVSAPRPGADDNPARAFDGKYLTVLRKGGPENFTYLEKPKVAKLEGRAFLVGTGADIPDNWQKGKPVWVAIDDIGEITVFDTLDELKKALEAEKKDTASAR